MGITRGMDGAEPLRPEPMEQPAGPREIREDSRSQLLAVGTLACPACDAPVAPGPVPLLPPDELACPVCAHGGRVRDFLSLDAPTRPARVEVRVRLVARW
jgi:hypothetical protein